MSETNLKKFYLWPLWQYCIFLWKFNKKFCVSIVCLCFFVCSFLSRLIQLLKIISSQKNKSRLSSLIFPGHPFLVYNIYLYTIYAFNRYVVTLPLYWVLSLKKTLHISGGAQPSLLPKIAENFPLSIDQLEYLQKLKEHSPIWYSTSKIIISKSTLLKEHFPLRYSTISNYHRESYLDTVVSYKMCSSSSEY